MSTFFNIKKLNTDGKIKTKYGIIKLLNCVKNVSKFCKSDSWMSCGVQQEKLSTVIVNGWLL